VGGAEQLFEEAITSGRVTSAVATLALRACTLARDATAASHVLSSGLAAECSFARHELEWAAVVLRATTGATAEVAGAKREAAMAAAADGLPLFAQLAGEELVKTSLLGYWERDSLLLKLPAAMRRCPYQCSSNC